MSSTLRTLSLLTLILFILGIFASSYFLYNLPNDIANTSSIDTTDLIEAQPILSKLFAIVAITFIAGISSIVITIILFQKGNTRESVVYVQSGKDETKSDILKKNIGAEEEEAVLSDTSKYNDIIKEDIGEKEKVDKLLSKLCLEVDASQAAFYKANLEGDIRTVHLLSSFAYTVAESDTVSFEFGEGLVGQAAKEQKIMSIDDIPEGYVKVFSGLGASSPKQLFIVPLVSNNETIAVVEISSFAEFSRTQKELITVVFETLAKSIAGDAVEEIIDEETDKIENDD